MGWGAFGKHLQVMKSKKNIQPMCAAGDDVWNGNLIGALLINLKANLGRPN